MDTIEERLHDTSKTCFDCYEVWSKDKKNPDARSKLHEAIHELRKVASRLEIELAANERSEAQKPIPIPPHRDAKRRSRKDHDAESNLGNVAEAQPHDQDDGQGPSRKRTAGGGRRSKGPKKSSEGNG